MNQYPVRITKQQAITLFENDPDVVMYRQDNEEEIFNNVTEKFYTYMRQQGCNVTKETIREIIVRNFKKSQMIATF